MDEILSDGGPTLGEAGDPAVRFQPEQWPSETVIVECDTGIIAVTTGEPPMGVGSEPDEAWPPSANPSVEEELRAQVDIGSDEDMMYCYYYAGGQVALGDVCDLPVVEVADVLDRDAAMGIE